MSDKKEFRLVGYKRITGTITCETGLHIGGTSDRVEIGGIDNPIIRNPLTNLPYIPGSSIKGKMRSLIEWRYGKVGNSGDVHSCKNTECPVCRVFGTTAGDMAAGPTRLIVRDANLTTDSKKELKDMQKEKGLIYAENKTENSINRLTARANPRTQERVPAGTVFYFEMVYRVFDLGDGATKDEELYAKVVEEGIELLNKMDALGGSGSRGYGKVDIKYETELVDYKSSDCSVAGNVSNE